MAASDSNENEYAILNLRTTESVRQELKKRAKEQERSVNYVHDKVLRQALGLDRKEAA